jgi:hypothetical protein
VTAPVGGEAAGGYGEGHERGNGPTANRGAKLEARKEGIGTFGSSTAGSHLHESRTPGVGMPCSPKKLAPQTGSNRHSDRACILETGEGLDPGFSGVFPGRYNPYLVIFVCQRQNVEFLMLCIWSRRLRAELRGLQHDVPPASKHEPSPWEALPTKGPLLWLHW